MGLTHYWRRPMMLPADLFGKAAGDCRELLSDFNPPLASARFGRETIAFEAGVERFELRQIETDRRNRPEVFGFCKTGGGQYDLAVKAALVIAKHHLGDLLTVTSDESEQNWDEARGLVHNRLGYGD